MLLVTFSVKNRISLVRQQQRALLCAKKLAASVDHHSFAKLLVTMVFKGQDAWRKHPLLTGCHKTPFPHFGLAVKIFAGYLVVSAYFKHIHGELCSVMTWWLMCNEITVLPCVCYFSFFFSSSCRYLQAHLQILHRQHWCIGKSRSCEVSRRSPLNV